MQKRRNNINVSEIDGFTCDVSISGGFNLPWVFLPVQTCLLLTLIMLFFFFLKKDIWRVYRIEDFVYHTLRGVIKQSKVGRYGKQYYIRK